MPIDPPPRTSRAKDNPPHSRCSFCGRPRAEAGPMVEGPGDVYICAECVSLSAEIVAANPGIPGGSGGPVEGRRQAGHIHLR